MYTIRVNNKILFSENSADANVLNAKLKLEANKAGSLTFEISRDHYLYDEIEMFKSLVEVYQNDNVIFYGFPAAESFDLLSNKTVEVNGILASLNYSIIHTARGTGLNLSTVLSRIISAHNLTVDSNRRFSVNMPTSLDGLIGEWSNNMIPAFDTFKKALARFGYNYIVDSKNSSDVFVIDVVQDSRRDNDQILSFGKNILDYAKDFDYGKLVTRLYPLGAKGGIGITGENERLTISSVNSGLNYLDSTALISSYGILGGSVVFDDITDAQTLKTAGLSYIANQFVNMTLELSAVDLGLYNADINAFKLLDRVRVLSHEFGIDEFFTVSKISLDLINPAKNKITLGKSNKVGISSQTGGKTETATFTANPCEYSYDEVLVGKWVDNKSLYQKSFKIDNVQGTATLSTGIRFASIPMHNAYLQISNHYYPLPYAYATSSASSFWVDNDGKISVTAGQYGAGGTAYITLQYTKQ